MKLISKRFELVRSVWFFLNTLFLSPSRNPSFFLFLSAGIFLTVAGDVKPPDVLFMMFVCSISTSRTGDLFRVSSRELSPFIHLIPLSLSDTLKRVFYSSVLYGVLAQAIFLIILIHSLHLPRLGNAFIAYQKAGSGEIISILAGFVTDISGRAEIPVQIQLRPSLIFGVVKNVSGWEIPIVELISIAILFISVTIYFTISKLLSACYKPEPLIPYIHVFVNCCFYMLGCLFFIDMIFPSAIIWKWFVSYHDSCNLIFQIISVVIVGFILIALTKHMARVHQL